MSGGRSVVVVGGGYAGCMAAKGLDKDFDVTLVAGQEVMVHAVAGLRASVVSSWVKRCLIPYTKLLKSGKVVHSPAATIDAEGCKVILVSGEELRYDFLILATGLLGPKTVGMAGRSVTVADITALYKKRELQISAATDILVVGGGSVGIEIAGEIMETYPDKKVNLVTSSTLMVSPLVALSDKFRASLKSKLEAVGVTVHLNNGRIEVGTEAEETGFITGRRTYQLKEGQLEADLCILATGTMQASSLYEDSGLGGWLDERGQVKVNDTAEVKGAGGGGKVFAIGDCNDMPIPKVAFLATDMGTAVCKNIRASTAGKPLKKMVPFVPVASIVPVGSKGGASQLPFMVAGDFVTRKIKSADLVCGKFWAAANMGKAPAL